MKWYQILVNNGRHEWYDMLVTTGPVMPYNSVKFWDKSCGEALAIAIEEWLKKQEKKYG